jgi:hypothetical protein
MIRSIPMHEFRPPMSRLMHAQRLLEKFLFSTLHQLPSEPLVIPAVPAACNVNTFVLLPLGEKVTVDMIAFSSMRSQNYQGCVSCKLPADKPVSTLDPEFYEFDSLRSSPTTAVFWANIGYTKSTSFRPLSNLDFLLRSNNITSFNHKDLPVIRNVPISLRTRQFDRSKPGKQASTSTSTFKLTGLRLRSSSLCVSASTLPLTLATSRNCLVLYSISLQHYSHRVSDALRIICHSI